MPLVPSRTKAEIDTVNSTSIEIKPMAPYVKSWDVRLNAANWRPELLKAITLREIERIFTVTDALGISREELVIPLRPEHPGRVRRTTGGKIEIVVDQHADFDQ